MSIVSEIAEGLGAGAGGSNPVTAVATLGSKIIDALGLDPSVKAKAALDLATLQQNGDLERLAKEVGLLQGQIDVNKVEAASPSMFIGGWRPGAGWICVIALGCYFLPKFLLGALFWSVATWKAGALLPYPDLGIADVLGLLGSLLGIGGLRTVEKRMGVATTSVGRRSAAGG